MRCIEITTNYQRRWTRDTINRNMRCIEMAIEVVSKRQIEED